jgi:translation initiation factor 4E|tara:strand:+ start:205 stop:729 length:525 start_codon:yes stop_codon:yes gene_type:complete
MDTKTVMTDIPSTKLYLLSDTWVLWAHLPHVTDWSLTSYIKIMEIKELNDILSLYKSIPDKMIKNCMLFLMRKGINPTWEDPANCKGGCFSYKVSKSIADVWRQLSYSIVGESTSNDSMLMKDITGITISPKKSFCIVKIWMRSTQFQSASDINNIPGLNSYGCIFKKHKPDYR